ncbi:hypothetical protein ACWGQ5_38990 [Streptomyces sp. NPDC055722]
MKKSIRRIATTGVSAAVVAGAFLVNGSSATAAVPQTAGRTPAPTTTADTGHDIRPHTDPWIADQLALFALP